MSSTPNTLRSWLGRPSKTNLMPGQYACGIDIGATTVGITIIDYQGIPSLKDPLEAPIPVAEGPDACLTIIRNLFHDTAGSARIDRHNVATIGLDSPGPSTRDGVLFKSPNLNHANWVNYGLRAAVEQLLGIPTIYANDGDIGAWLDDLNLAPASVSAGVQRSTAGIYVGTGTGGGIVLDGKLWQGKSGASAEFGHIPVIVESDIYDEEIPICGCGSRGCIEAYASLTALDRQLRYLLDRLNGRELNRDYWPKIGSFKSSGASLPFEAISDNGTKRAQQILRLADEDNAIAVRLLAKQATVLGKFIAGLVCFNEPDNIVIGGGILTASEKVREMYLARVKAAFAAEAFFTHVESCQIVFSEFEDAAAYASALRAATLFEGASTAA